jgi:Mrp family chromosome partitioning ATPase
MKTLLQGTSPQPGRAGTEAGLEQVLGRLQSLAQNLHRACVLGVVGCKSGDGATFVADALARDLATLSRKRVLQADCEDLLAASALPSADIIAHCFYTDQSGRWRLTLPRAKRGPRALMPDGDPRDTIRVLDSHFDFVLLDCAAVTAQGWLWQVAPLLDDLFLVVAHGETRRDQVRYAQQLIAQAGARLSGCILNKRKYPLPGMLYRMMG